MDGTRRLLIIARRAVVSTSWPASKARSDDRLWIPLRTGNEWVYSTKRSRFMGSKGPFGSGGKLNFEGKLVERVVDRGHTSKSKKYFIEQRFVEKCKDLNFTIKRKIKSATTVDKRSFLMHSQELESDNFLSDFYSTPAMKCKPPIRLLKKGLKPGDKWKGGGLKARIRAKVLDPETVKTETGRFRNCMKIEFKGKVSGTIEGWYGSNVDGGTFKEVYWYAKRVGLVKYRGRQEMDIALGNGNTFTLTDNVTRVLRGKTVRLPKIKKEKEQEEERQGQGGSAGHINARNGHRRSPPQRHRDDDRVSETAPPCSSP